MNGEPSVCGPGRRRSPRSGAGAGPPRAPRSGSAGGSPRRGVPSGGVGLDRDLALQDLVPAAVDLPIPPRPIGRRPPRTCRSCGGPPSRAGPAGSISHSSKRIRRTVMLSSPPLRWRRPGHEAGPPFPRAARLAHHAGDVPRPQSSGQPVRAQDEDVARLGLVRCMSTCRSGLPPEGARHHVAQGVVRAWSAEMTPLWICSLTHEWSEVSWVISPSRTR